MKRRDFLWMGTATALAASRSARLLAESSNGNLVTLHIGASTGIAIPDDFVGLSYESAQLGTLSSFHRKTPA